MHQADSDIRNRLLVARLPVMPQILVKLIEKCQTEEVGMAALAELIAKDPGMTGKIMGVANSSAYYRSGQKAGLEQALATLGTNMIKTLVISESVFQVFNSFSHSNSTDLRNFWKHSLSAAVMAREIALKMSYPNVEEAYLAGLLHDVGRLALLSAATKDYAFIFLARDDENLCPVEQSLLNITHSEAGAWLAARWNLDSFLSDSLLYHHEPVARLEGTHPLIRIVLLAHLMSCYVEDDPTVKAAGLLCGIEATDLELISKGSSSQVEKFAELLGIDLAGADELTAPTAGWDIAGLLAGMDEGNESTVPVVRDPGVPPVQENAKKMLVDEVRNMVLSSELGRSFSSQQGGEAGLFETITRSARLLFDFEDAAILLMNHSAKVLVGVPVGEHKQRLKEFSIALAGGGKIVDAVLQRQLAFIVNGQAPLSIAEEQLLRLLGSESLVCVPLASGSRCLGVVIGGVAAWQLPGLQARERFLGSFGEQAAASIIAATSGKGEVARELDRAAEEYRDASRRVAHEANNALSIIRNYLGALDSKLEKQELVVGEMAIIHGEIDRVGQIILGLSEAKPPIVESVTEINHLVREVVSLFRETSSVPASIRITAQTQDAPAEVEGSVGVLKQVLVNLVKNAIEAMPSGGDIQIVNNGRVNRDGRLYTELCVIDSGPGISPEILETLFLPVRTSKGDGHQGLGLSIVQGLVKQIEGLITCRSSSRGTTFEILLPLRQARRTDHAVQDSIRGS